MGGSKSIGYQEEAQGNTRPQNLRETSHRPSPLEVHSETQYGRDPSTNKLVETFFFFFGIKLVIYI